LAHNRLRVCVAALVLGAIAFGLAGCGRNGAPEKPTGPGLWPWPSTQPTANAAPADPAAAPPPGGVASNQAVPGANPPPGQTTAAKTGFDANGNPVAAAGQKKSFLLDPILQ
jgi:hypothetical protein